MPSPFSLCFPRVFPSRSAGSHAVASACEPSRGNPRRACPEFVFALLDGLRWARDDHAVKTCLLQFGEAFALDPNKDAFHSAVAHAMLSYGAEQRADICRALECFKDAIASASLALINTPDHDGLLRYNAVARVEGMKRTGWELDGLLAAVSAHASRPPSRAARETLPEPRSFDAARYAGLLDAFLDGIARGVDNATLRARFERLVEGGGAKVAMNDAELDACHATIELALSRLSDDALAPVLARFEDNAAAPPLPPSGGRRAPSALKEPVPLPALIRSDEVYGARELVKIRSIARRVASNRSGGTPGLVRVRELANRLTLLPGAIASDRSGGKESAAPQLQALAEATQVLNRHASHPGQANQWLDVAPEGQAKRLDACCQRLGGIFACATACADASLLDAVAGMASRLAPQLTRLTDPALVQLRTQSTSSGSNIALSAEVASIAAEVEATIDRMEDWVISDSLVHVAALVPNETSDMAAPATALASVEQREHALKDVDHAVHHARRIALMAGASDRVRQRLTQSTDLTKLNARIGLLLRSAGHLLTADQLSTLAECEGLGMPMVTLCRTASELRFHASRCLEADSARTLADALANATRAAIRLTSDTLYHAGSEPIDDARNAGVEMSGPMVASAIGHLTVHRDRRELARLHARLAGPEFRALAQVLTTLAGTPAEELIPGTDLGLPGIPDFRLLAGMRDGYNTVQQQAAFASGKRWEKASSILEDAVQAVKSFLCGNGKVLDPGRFFELETPEPIDKGPKPSNFEEFLVRWSARAAARQDVSDADSWQSSEEIANPDDEAEDARKAADRGT
ncbi:hypothetical protein L602_002800000690 [Cupriavidus gilardii J11]|uniref:Uncharacterized protein n=1 Tax=Cupriavidus gilardii J11 TaxID=936133 RepID=A0A562BHA2_9BURK|nr:hypothetical protein L602_002800000690 [Cupriavidus gilardii J11]